MSKTSETYGMNATCYNCGTVDWVDCEREMSVPYGKYCSYCGCGGFPWNFSWRKPDEETEMEKLHLMVKALEGSERGFAEHYTDEGDYEAARDCTMKANGMGKILDVMAEYFGEEEGDADREGD